MAHGPVDDVGSFSVWTGASLIRFTGGSMGLPGGGAITPDDVAAWDATSDRWVMLAKMPFWPGLGTGAVWTGREALVVNDLYPPVVQPAMPVPAAVFGLRLGP